MWVMKVGGGCLREAEGIRQLQVVLNEAYPDANRLLVVSALGKTTNNLLSMAEAAGHGDLQRAREYYNRLKHFHEEIIRALFPTPSVQALSKDLEEKYWIPLWQKVQALTHLPEEDGPATDAVLVYGELISSQIVWNYLKQQGYAIEWIDARRLIVTDGSYPEPNVLMGPSQANIDAQLIPLFRSYPLVITQGYIASDLRRRSVTLGREGSDYSAAIFAQMLRAKGMIAWKDVEGIYSADPRLSPEAQPLSQLSYEQAAEITHYGAQILHPRTLRPLQEAQIPLYIRPYFNPTAEGSQITQKPNETPPPIYAFRKGLTLIEVQTTDLTPISINTLFQSIEGKGIEVFFIQAGMRTTALAVRGTQETIERWKISIPSKWQAQIYHPVTLHTILYPSAEVKIPNGEAAYFQKLPNRLHWLAYGE
ncbi:MAG: aspartate kinase [Bacteroidia bacterium]|nr:aspartate kinase [Bacteroidia bacterium]MDW8133737.1 aspartate kinase [Bacteroidia bacterium]